MYKPPFSITNEILVRSISISQKIEQFSSYHSLKRMPFLRRNNKIKSIYSSLAIEANSLSLNQIKDVIDGKIVIGPKKEIQETKNAYKAYEMIKEFDGFKEKDLLKAHAIITFLIDNESGTYRNHGEGVMDESGRVIHVAPSEKMVPMLMNNLFEWLKNDKQTPLLIKSCIFHYELVFIHPFNDGNGRAARLWQNVLLAKWDPLFEYVPIESQIHKYQKDYYSAIEKSNKIGNSNCFIEFMLKMIDETLDEMLIIVKKESKNISEQVNKLLEIMEFEIPLSANEIMTRLGIKSKETLRASYLNPALKNGLKCIVCVGESLADRNTGKTFDVIRHQIEECVRGLYENELESVIIAYEPIWAIGTGQNASVKDVENAAKVVRKVIYESYSEKASRDIQVLYGGRLNEKNAGALLNCAGIDGGLFGKLSLNVNQFLDIANNIK